jgi:hypothetical protein
MQTYETQAAKEQPAFHEPRWPAVITILAVGGLYLALPADLSVGPRWLLLALAITVQVAQYFIPVDYRDRFVPILSHMLLAIITMFMAVSIGLLIHALPQQTEPAKRLLGSAVSLWFTNMIVFANWYWLLDAGGPHKRDLRIGHTDGALLFPQMALNNEMRSEMGETNWSPQFMDYLFLAFNTSTAFSPTDVQALSRWVKLLMMIQSLISLTVISLLAARAVNIL